MGKYSELINNLIKLANDADSMGMFHFSDHIDNAIQPAGQISEEDKRTFLNILYKQNTLISGHDLNHYSRGGSLWLMTNGDLLLVPYDHFDSAKEVLAEMYGKDAVHDSNFRNLIRNNGLYETIGDLYGAIRVHVYKAYKGLSMDVVVNSQPTEQQLSILKSINDSTNPDATTVEVSIGEGRYQDFNNIHDFANTINNQQAQQQTGYQEMSDKVDTQNNVEIPAWKALELRNLEEQYPGNENQKIRELYQKSASIKLINNIVKLADKADSEGLFYFSERISDMIKYANSELPREEEIRELYEKSANKKLNQLRFANDYYSEKYGLPPLTPPSEEEKGLFLEILYETNELVEENLLHPTLGHDSYWLMSNGDILLCAKGHNYSVNTTLELMGKSGKNFKKWLNRYSTYEMMSIFFGAIRIYNYIGQGKQILSQILSQLPNQTQMEALKYLNSAINPDNNNFEMRNQNGTSSKYDSIYDFMDKINYIPESQKTQYQEMSDTLNEQDIDGMPAWRALELKNLEEQYPGQENQKIRDLYQKSAHSKFKRVI